MKKGVGWGQCVVEAQTYASDLIVPPGQEIPEEKHTQPLTTHDNERSQHKQQPRQERLVLLFRRQSFSIPALPRRSLQSKQRGDKTEALLCRSDIHGIGLHKRVTNYRSVSLAGWSRRKFCFFDTLCLCSGVFVASSAVDGNDLVSVDASFADGTSAPLILHLKPSIQARPAVEMATEGDNRLGSKLQGVSGTRSVKYEGGLRGHKPRQIG
jgi:hypothetical protein